MLERSFGSCLLTTLKRSIGKHWRSMPENSIDSCQRPKLERSLATHSFPVSTIPMLVRKESFMERRRLLSFAVVSLIAAAGIRPAAAQLAPTGAHYAAQASDTGFSGT